MPDDAQYQPTQPSESTGGSFFSWLVIAVVAITVLTLAAVHAPGRMKLVGLYAIAYGLVAGFGLGRLARMLQIVIRPSVTTVAAALIAAGQVGMAVESHRIWSAKQLQAIEQTPASRQARQMLNNDSVPPELKKSLQETIDRQHAELRFENHLARRLSQLGDWPAPWPLVFWLAEVTLGSLIGCWLMRRMITAESKS